MPTAPDPDHQDPPPWQLRWECPALEAAWRRLNPYSPRLDRQLDERRCRELGDQDAAEGLAPGQRRAVGWLRSCPERILAWTKEAYPELRVVHLAEGLETALAWGEQLGPGRLYALGGRSYSRAQRDRLRCTQRLLPWAEVALYVAFESAVWESDPSPLWVSLELSVLAPVHLPGWLPTALGGPSPQELLAGLALVPGARVVGLDVSLGPQAAVAWEGLAKDRRDFTALTAGELLRDNILTWWCR